jgi:hypothetical protein
MWHFGKKGQIERHSHLLANALYLISLARNRMENRNCKMQLNFIIQKCNMKYHPPLNKTLYIREQI